MSAVLPPGGVAGVPAQPAALPLEVTTRMKGEDRLIASRAHMRAWLDGGKSDKSAAARARRNSWFDAFTGHPVVAVAMSAASGWWANHPLRAVVALVDGGVRTTLGPAARKQPLAVVGIGLAVGAMAVWLRPWRWILRPALFVGLASQVVNRVIAEMPLDTVMKLFNAFTGPKAPAPVTPAEGVRQSRSD